MLNASQVFDLNRQNKITETVGLGTEINKKAEVYARTLVAGDISGSVATVTTGITSTKFAGVMVVSSAGVVRAVINVTYSSGVLVVTATGITATDVLTAVLA